MKRMWDQLQSGERRWVAAIGVIVFLVLNYFLIWPHFSDWKKADARIDKARALMAQYQNEIKNRPAYEAKIKMLQSDGGSDVQEEDQAMDLVRFLRDRERSNDVQINIGAKPSVRNTDPFFVDYEMNFNAQGREAQMVSFLYSLGAGNSIVRIRGLSLRPDAAHQQINANVSIVASYAKRAPARAATSGAAAAPGKTPAAPTKAPAPAKAATPPAGKSSQTNKPIVAITHKNAKSNNPVPLTAKRP